MPPEQTLPARPRILAIDDTPANLMVLAAALTNEFSLQLAASGAAGLSIAEELPPDLILLDVMMPEMDGFETCRHFKANPNLKDVPIVFVTALTDQVSELEGLALGAADYLYKPVNITIARQRIRNLLEREALRKELDQYRNRLEDMVSQRTVELVAARDAAQVANRAKSAFLSNVSHELRTPLGVMLGMNYLLLQRLTDHVQRDKCHKIAQAGQHLQEMVEDILQVADLDGSSIHPGNYAFTPEATLSMVIARFSGKAQAKGLDIVTSLSPDVPKMLYGAPARIKQVLEQLLSNAIKFSERGVIDVRVLVANAPDGERQVRFEVEDQGIGIAPDMVQQLFSAFTLADESLSRAHQGLGIGLALCKQLVQSMGGEIGVDSVLGKGSCFWVQLQLSVQDTPSQPTSTAAVDEALPAVDSSDPAADLEQGTAEASSLRRMLRALESSDIEAINLWSETRHLLTPVLGERLPGFANALAEYDLQDARQILLDALQTARKARALSPENAVGTS